MPREKWKLTQQATGEPEVESWGEDLTLGYSLLRALAESDETLIEIEPGVWRHAEDGRLPKLSTLDAIFDGCGLEDGVEKLGPGAYRVRHDGWL